VSVAIGVDIGGTKMAVGVVDDAGEVLYRSLATTAGRGTEDLLAELEAQLRKALEAYPDVESIGLGLPSTIDRTRGVAVSSVNLPIVDVPIRDLIGDRLGLPTFLDNDANAAALAEHRLGVARGAGDVVMLTIGTGIGGGLILGGEVFRGSSGAAAELGHIVIDYAGPPCQGNCPNRGCVEALASGTAMGREGGVAADQHPDSALGRARAEGREIDGRLVTELAIEGDGIAVEVVALIGRRLGIALSSLANIFDPDVIVIGGGAAAAGDLLLEAAREQLRTRALPPMNGTRVVAAELGPEAGMIGAGTMAIEEIARERRGSG
jgi:glucokinase